MKVQTVIALILKPFYLTIKSICSKVHRIFVKGYNVLFVFSNIFIVIYGFKIKVK